MSGDIVLLGCGHAHLSALRHWRYRVRPVVVSRAAVEAYSGLVPSVLRRERDSAAMRLDRVVSAAGGRFVMGECVGIDLAARTLRLADGQSLGFGLLSLDLGGVSTAPVGAWPVRPASALPARIEAIEAGDPGRVVVVGAGAVGTELALSLAVRWRGRRAVALLAAGAPLPGAPDPVRHRAARALEEAGVSRLTGHAVSVVAGQVVTADGTRHAAAGILWAAAPGASPLPREAGLACDPAGFVAVTPALRSLSHDFVFAAGDAAALGTPKSGAVAVSSGRALAINLARSAEGRAPRRWRRPSKTLSIIGVGEGRALAWRGDAWAAGRAAWWLKQRLDARWMKGMS